MDYKNVVPNWKCKCARIEYNLHYRKDLKKLFLQYWDYDFWRLCQKHSKFCTEHWTVLKSFETEPYDPTLFELEFHKSEKCFLDED